MLTVLGRASLPPVYFAILPAMAGLILTGCGDGTNGATDDLPEIALTGRAICGGGGCGATLSSNTVPTTLAPNEKLVVDVVYNNSGTVTWDSNIALLSRSSPVRLFGTRLTQVSGTVAPAASYTFQFVVTAPASLGPATFSYQPFDLATGQFFGDPITIVITIQNQTANYACSLVSDTVPATLLPSTNYNVSYEIENTGLQAWPSPDFFFCDTDSNFWQGTHCQAPGSTMNPSDRVTLSETISAPASSGTFSLTRQMFDFSSGVRLGAISDVLDCVNLSVPVAGGSTPPFDASEDVGSRVVPGALSPGQLSTVTVVMTNTGTESWLADGSFALIPQDAVLGANRVTVQSVTANAATESFLFNIQAPGTAGTYNLDVQMNQLGGVGSFGSVVSIPITVSGGTPVLNAAEDVGSRNVPSTMAPNETRQVTIGMQNTGTQTWIAGNTFNLAQTDNRLFGNGSPVLTTNTAQSAVATFTFFITAPGVDGSYNLRRRMNNSGGAGFFGTEVVIPITVAAGTTPQYDATVISQVYPPRFTPGETLSASITLRNSGTGTWTGSAFALLSQNTPSNLWTRTAQGLGSCDPTPPGSDCVFSVNLAAPTVVGTYDSVWRMSQSGGVGLFGETATQSNIPVTFCGNGTIDSFTTPPETCDYGDAVAGDGCSDTCQLEPQTVDLAVDTVARTFRGEGAGHALGIVTSGDIDGDSSNELLLGESANFFRTTLRNSAGRVVVYESPALDNSTTTLPASSTLNVFGAEGGDALASLATGRVVAADVTGDGVDDLMTSAPLADGPSNARVDAGEVYVLTGGAALTATAGVDLLAPGSFLGAKFEGAMAGDNLTILAAGDLTGDGTADLVLGAPLSDGGAANSGQIIIVQGGSGLTAGTTFDMASASVFQTINGVGADDRLGSVAVVANIIGTSAPDLIIAANNNDAGGRSNAGVVYVFLRPAVRRHRFGQHPDPRDSRWRDERPSRQLGRGGRRHRNDRQRLDHRGSANAVHRHPDRFGGDLHRSDHRTWGRRYRYERDQRGCSNSGRRCGRPHWQRGGSR